MERLLNLCTSSLEILLQNMTLLRHTKDLLGSITELDGKMYLVFFS